MGKRFLFLLLFYAFYAKAQLPADNGIRYADVEYIFSRLPAAKQIESELKSLHAQLENKIKVRYTEFETKYSRYTSNSYPDSSRQRLERELQLLQESVEKLKQDSELILQRKQQQLMEPVTKSIQKAIADVAVENNFSFILNAGAGGQDLVLHAASGMDVSDQVLKKLGVVSPTAKE